VVASTGRGAAPAGFASGEARLKVALFIPCYVDQLYPQVGLATADLLERLGVEVVYPEEQTCCGQPLANAGFGEDAAALARRFLRIFDGLDHVVCPSGSCTSMVRTHYPALVPGEPALARVLPRTFELCEFLHDVLGLSRLDGRFPHRVLVHQSCHGLRELGLGVPSERQAPRAPGRVEQLLSGLAGLELVSPVRRDECCGFGGSFAVVEEAVSCLMGRDRLAEQLAAGAEIVTATDVSCLMHLEALARRHGSPLRFRHVAEILAEATA
jgi:L-lactate dehydrogenase complex protein LldE